MNLQDEILRQQSQRLADSVDFEILADALMRSCGWCKITLEPMVMEKSTAIDRWIKTHCQGHHLAQGLTWLFENSQDAIIFKLKWS